MDSATVVLDHTRKSLPTNVLRHAWETKLGDHSDVGPQHPIIRSDVYASAYDRAFFFVLFVLLVVANNRPIGKRPKSYSWSDSCCSCCLSGNSL